MVEWLYMPGEKVEKKVKVSYTVLNKDYKQTAICN